MATAESWREFFSFLTVPPDQSLIRLTIYYTEPIALLESDCHGFRATILEQIPGIDARRSEERRVGKECRSRRSHDRLKKISERATSRKAAVAYGVQRK